MDTNSFIVHVKTGDIYEKIPKDVEKNLILQIVSQKNRFQNEKKYIVLMKVQLDVKLIKESAGFKSETYSFFVDTVVKIKTEKTQQNNSSKEVLNLKIVWNQLGLKIK